jgi:hypothetical protein
LISCDDISEIQESITIQIHIDGNHLVNPVFNINFQRVKKRGREQEYEKKKEDGGQNKQQKVTGIVGNCKVAP